MNQNGVLRQNDLLCNCLNNVVRNRDDKNTRCAIGKIKGGHYIGMIQFFYQCLGVYLRLAIYFADSEIRIVERWCQVPCQVPGANKRHICISPVKLFEHRFYFLVILKSTLLFNCRWASVSFGTNGFVPPYPF